jgi:hypothetical protein
MPEVARQRLRWASKEEAFGVMKMENVSRWCPRAAAC